MAETKLAEKNSWPKPPPKVFLDYAVTFMLVPVNFEKATLMAI